MADDPIHVTLTDEATIQFVRAKVRSGEYASEADMVRESLSILRDDEAELERWLEEEIAERARNLDADPSSAIPIEEVEAHLAERRRRRAALAS
jgi:antitoxin ParD1/3/4